MHFIMSGVDHTICHPIFLRHGIVPVASDAFVHTRRRYLALTIAGFILPSIIVALLPTASPVELCGSRLGLWRRSTRALRPWMPQAAPPFIARSVLPHNPRAVPSSSKRCLLHPVSTHLAFNLGKIVRAFLSRTTREIQTSTASAITCSRLCVLMLAGPLPTLLYPRGHLATAAPPSARVIRTALLLCPNQRLPTP